MKVSKKLDSFNEALYSDNIRKELINFEPKRIHRFMIEFPNVNSYLIQKINKPKYINGKWSDIKIEFIDLISPSSSQQLFGLTNPKDYPIVFDERSFVDKLLGKPIFTFMIKALDPTGVVIENWTIDVKKIKSIDFGEFDYGNDGVAFLNLTIQPKKCVLNF